MRGVQRAPVLALVDGEHHPAAVRDALEQLDRERGVAGVAFVRGEEQVRREVLDDPIAHYGFALEFDPEQALRRTEARAVVDLADEPVLPPAAKLRLAALALHLGLAYEMPGTVLEPPTYEPFDFDGPRLAVIGTGKRTGKTAVAGHWATLLRERGSRPVIVSMGRGGPTEPQLANENTTLADLRAIAADGRHAASDYLEDAVLAGVPTVGCRRVGGGLAGAAVVSNVVAGARLAAEQDPGVVLFEGSGASLPPVEADATVCVVGSRAGALHELGPYRLLRSRLALVSPDDAQLVAEVARWCRGPEVRFTLEPEPVDPLPEGARVAFFTT